MDLPTSALALILSVLVAVVPTILYALVIWWSDRYEKEPRRLLAAAFVWGALPAVVISLLAEVVFGVSLPALQIEGLGSVLQATAMAPVVEEVAKGLALAGLLLFFRNEFDDALDGLVYGALVGIGFGMTENFVYFLGAFFDGGWPDWGLVVFLRSAIFGLNHAFFTAFTGVGLGLGRLAPRARSRLVFSLAGVGAAILFHGLHNLGISLTEVWLGGVLISLLSNAGGLLVLLVIVLLAWRQERRWIQVELADEVDRLVTGPEYAQAALYAQRVRGWWSAFQRGGWRAARRQGRLHHLLTELAFRKHQARVRGDSEGAWLAADIERIREEIVAAQR